MDYNHPIRSRRATPQFLSWGRMLQPRFAFLARELYSPQRSANTAYGPPLLFVPFAPSVLYCYRSPWRLVPSGYSFKKAARHPRDP